MKARIVILSSLLAAFPAFGADCTYPKQPDSVPDGKTASEAEMVSAMTTFKQYNADVTSYLACLDSETSDKIREAGGATSAIMQIKSMQSKKHNSAVDELTAVTGKFNEQVRTFKARK
jgi:3-keto-L-gulonate-6-phosphate decarboxylase